jgi:hypothetical protein
MQTRTIEGIVQYLRVCRTCRVTRWHRRDSYIHQKTVYTKAFCADCGLENKKYHHLGADVALCDNCTPYVRGRKYDSDDYSKLRWEFELGEPRERPIWICLACESGRVPVIPVGVRESVQERKTRNIEAVRAVMGFGLTNAQIARRVGLDESTVKRYKRIILNIPPK